MSAVISSSGPEQTRAIGSALAAILAEGDVVLLHGDLGSGKTTLAQGVGSGMGVSLPVRSPTFTFRMEQAGGLPGHQPVELVHVDLYRIEDPGELEHIGYRELIDDPRGVVLIEWPERAGEWLPSRFLAITFETIDTDQRLLTVTSHPADAGQIDALDRFTQALRQAGLEVEWQSNGQNVSARAIDR